MTAAQQREEHRETVLEPGLLCLKRPFASYALTHHPVVPLLASTTPAEAGAVLRRMAAVRLPFLTTARGPGR